MCLKLIIACSILIWKADSQTYQPNIDIEKFIFGNIPSSISQFNIDPYGVSDNSFSRQYSQNTDQSLLNNGLGAEKRSSDYVPNVRTQQATPQNKKQTHHTTYQPLVQQQKQSKSQNYQKNVPQLTPQNLQSQQPQNLQLQQQNLQQNLPQQANYYQQNQQQQQQNLQLGQPSYLQSVQPQQQNIKQQQQQNYQQNVQPHSQYNQQNVQPQQQDYQLNQQQQTSQQYIQPQSQYYQQNLQPQQQNYFQNQQNQQQQNSQQNVKPQSQYYQQNLQSQQQNYLQNQQNQQQLPVYQQNQQPQIYGPNNQNYYSGQTQTAISGGLPSTFGTVNTGKTSQNANYNNETFAITKFGLKLFKAVISPGNNVISPYSIALLLALVQQGALGYTQQEITQALQLTPEASQSLFKKLTALLKKRGSSNILKIASNVYLSNDFIINSKFKSNAINTFGSDITLTNFNDAYGTSARINGWVADKTSYKITNLLKPEAIQPESLMVLVNAVYFKGTWDIKFRPELSANNIFTLSDGSQKQVKFMHATRMVRTDVDPVLKSQILLLPFEGGQYSMMFILPLKGNNVNDVLLSLTEPQLYSYQSLTPKEVKLQIPKFSVKQDSDVYTVLSALGLWTMFSNEAELSGIGNKQGISPRISSGLHSALLSIDENGGSAEAATSLSVVALSYDDPSTSFTADRPFIAILWDNKLSMPLFMAKVEDPDV